MVPLAIRIIALAVHESVAQTPDLRSTQDADAAQKPDFGASSEGLDL